jgi:hypothetical protein
MFLVSAEAAAQTNWDAWQLQWENDAFAAFSGSDEHYTNGLRFSWVRNPDLKRNPEWTDRFAEWWCPRISCGPRDAFPAIAYGHSLVHTFYTPEDITVEPLIATDRPYAGHLYFGTQLMLRGDTHPDDPDRNRPTENYFDLQVGFVGPEAGAEWLQTRVHELIDDDTPQGWDNQLDFEPTVELIYRWRRKLGDPTFDVVPHLGGGVGNVMVFAEAGATARLGHNISAFGDPTIFPTATPVDLQVTDWEYYLFAGAAGRGVAHNVFLDGNTFSDSHSVDRENWVYDLIGGFFVRYKKYQLHYTFTRRSREYSPSFDDDGGRHDYGSIAFSYLIAWPPN